MISASSLGNATTQAYTAANLKANEAVFFNYGSSSYLSANDAIAAFSDTTDLLVKFGSLINPPTTVGALTVTNYFAI